MIHEFHLSPPGSGRGVSCDAHGAFIGDVPLLKRSLIDGKEKWEPRECSQLSKEITAQFGLPIDMTSKMGGVSAISNALTEGDIPRAQIAAILLAIPDLPVLSKGAHSSSEQIAFIRDLHWSGLIKADWDPDEHPRWPAGAPDSQGGEFVPKADDTTAGQTFREGVAPRETSTDLLDADTAERSQPFDSRTRSNIQPALQIDNEGTLSSILDGTGQAAGNISDAEDRGIYADYGGHIGGTQLAAASIPMEGLGIAEANPANWANATRLANGALRLGSGQIIAAVPLLAAMDAHTERAAVSAAINKFGFDPTTAADVLAARAYIWARHYAPLNYFDVPWNGPQLESVSQSTMALELARPGTLYLATQGDKPSAHYISVAAKDGMQNGAIFESRARPPTLPAALQTTSETARAALNLRTNDQMRAHHLIPANVWEKRSDIAMLAHRAGWEPNSLANLIELPANAETQDKMAAEGARLPIHSSSHKNYDETTLGEIIIERAEYGDTLTPAQARAILEKVSMEMRKLILEGRWMPRLR